MWKKEMFIDKGGFDRLDIVSGLWVRVFRSKSTLLSLGVNTIMMSILT